MTLFQKSLSPHFIYYVGQPKYNPGAGVGRGIQQCEYQGHCPLVHWEAILDTNYNTCFIYNRINNNDLQLDGGKGKFPTDYFLKNTSVSIEFSVAQVGFN